MVRTAVVAAALLYAKLTVAEYDQFYFPTKGDSNKCQNTSYACDLPGICAHEGVTDVHYCCTSGQKDAVCWTNMQTCRGEDKKPATGQLGCPTNASPNGYCCRSEKERCTLRAGQINICWAVPENPVANLTGELVNNTYSSLLSASPSAKTLAVNIAALLTSASSTSTTAPTSSPKPSNPQSPSSSPTTSNAPPPSSTPSNSSSSISGGAVGGIVVGAVGGLALVSGAFFLLFRRRNAKNASSTSTNERAHTAEMDGASNPYLNSSNAYSPLVPGPESAKYAHYTDAPREMGTEGHQQNMPVEMPGNAAQEMDAGVSAKGSSPPSRAGPVSK